MKEKKQFNRDKKGPGFGKKPSVTMSDIKRFKDLDAKRRSGKMSEPEFEEAKELAFRMKKGKVSGHAGNDVSWYKEYPELIKNSANIIFNEIAGTKFELGLNPVAFDSAQWPLVGIRANVCPTIGRCNTANDAFNYQMRNLWLTLHRAYRGIGTYEYADLGIAMYSIMAAFADIARAERIYGCLSFFNSRNRSYPDALLNALGLDISAIGSVQLADFRYQLNRIIAKAKVLCLPNGLPVFNQYITLFGNVFKDADNVRAQWIVYDSPYLMKYDPTFTTGSSVTYGARTATGGSGKQTLVDIIADINDQLDTLLSDTDVARMCSDLLKAFGDNGVQGLEFIPEDFVLVPVRDDSRLLQLHNTTLTGDLIGNHFSSTILTALGSFTSARETLRIYQEGGIVKHNLSCTFLGTAGTTTVAPADYRTVSGEKVYGSTSDKSYAVLPAVILDTWEEDPSEDSIVEMTRQALPLNAYSYVDSGTTYYGVEIVDFPTYVVMSIEPYTQKSTTPVGLLPFNISQFTSVSTANAGLIVASAFSQVDWHPFLMLQYVVSGVLTSVHMIYDYDNYTLISKEALSRLHDACNLSVFHFPQMSSISD